MRFIPTVPAAKANKRNGRFTNAPFLSPAKVVDSSAPVDFIAAGDFDGDTHWDVATSFKGSKRLLLLTGDGSGNVNFSKEIYVDGTITAMIRGDINRQDGLDDLILGVTSAAGNHVLVFEGQKGAANAVPESFSVPDTVSDLAIGELNGRYEPDLAIAAGRSLVVLHGRDRKTYLTAPDSVESPVLTTRSFEHRIKSLTIADFTDATNANRLKRVKNPALRRPDELALITEDGHLWIFGSDGTTDPAKPILKNWRPSSEQLLGPDAKLLGSSRVSGESTNSLLISDDIGSVDLISSEKESRALATRRLLKSGRREEQAKSRRLSRSG